MLVVLVALFVFVSLGLVAVACVVVGWKRLTNRD